VHLDLHFIGDRIAVAAGNGYGVVAWTDTRNWPTSSDIYAARIYDVPVAVNAVSDLSAEPLADGVRVGWVVNDGSGISGLRVYRSDPDATNEVVLGSSDITPVRPGRFDFKDTSAQPGRAYLYRLQIHRGAAIEWLGPLVYHAAAKDTRINENCKIYGVLDERFTRIPLSENPTGLGGRHVVNKWPEDSAWDFVAVGRGQDPAHLFAEMGHPDPEHLQGRGQVSMSKQSGQLLTSIDQPFRALD